jgi:putative PIN family toxin of toxin-antitoxin system
VRVVFDSNIFISAFVFPGSMAERAIVKIIEGDDSLYISKEILDEVLSVLSSKFSRDTEAISRVALNLSELAEFVSPTEKIRVLRDEPDNRILECAVCADADIIVTGDKEMLKLREHGKIGMMSLKEYLAS